MKSVVCGRLRAVRHLDRNLFEDEFLRGQQPRVAHDDHARLINDDRLAKSELSDRRGDRINGTGVLTEVIFIRFDSLDGVQ